MISSSSSKRGSLPNWEGSSSQLSLGEIMETWTFTLDAHIEINMYMYYKSKYTKKFSTYESLSGFQKVSSCSDLILPDVPKLISTIYRTFDIQLIRLVTCWLPPQHGQSYI